MFQRLLAFDLVLCPLLPPHRWQAPASLLLCVSGHLLSSGEHHLHAPQTHESQGKCQVNLHGVETVSLTPSWSSSKGLAPKHQKYTTWRDLLFGKGKKLANHKTLTLQLSNSFHVQFRSSMSQTGKTGWLAASAKILMYLQPDFLFVSLYKCSSQILYKQLKGDFLSRHLRGSVCTDLSRTPRV